LFHPSRERIVKITEMALIVRLVSTMLVVIALVKYYPFSLEFRDSIIGIFIILFVIFLLLMGGDFLGWYVMRLFNLKSTAGLDLFIYVIFLAFISAVVILTEGAYSNYKILYLPVILYYSVKCGRWWGIIASLFITLFLMGINYYYHLQGMAVSPEIDVVFCGIFILTSWMVGSILDMEREIIKNLSRKVLYDELTGLNNHRYFQDTLDELIQGEKPFNLLLIDLDYFNRINEVLGYHKGDQILVETAGMVSRHLNREEMIFRYGSDEFAVISPGEGNNRAFELAEKIRESIKNIDIKPMEVFWEEKLSTSIGIVNYPGDALTKEELLNKLDEALYRARVISGDKIEAYFSVLENIEAKNEQESEKKALDNLKTFLAIIHARDRFTYGHSERVLLYCTLLAELLDLEPEQKELLQYGAFLHDIGKIEIDRQILNKPDRLDQHEWKIVKKHPTWGAEMLKKIPSLEHILPAVLYHHERYDGDGYPFGLAKDTIPLSARILNVANAFDAMTVDQYYQKAKSLPEAMTELETNCYRQFDPRIVELFLKHLKNYRSIEEVVTDISRSFFKPV